MGLFEEVKAVEKKTSKEVTDLAEKNFDYKNKKDVNNVYGEAFLKGYYTEMKDPKNAEKTVNEIKEIVAKNLAKDQLHYVKDGQFGERGVGYTDEHPGLKASKSDQMEKVKLKENLETHDSKKSTSIESDNYDKDFADKLDDLTLKYQDQIGSNKKAGALLGQLQGADSEEEASDLEKKLKSALKKKSKKETIETKLAEIDRASSIVALETKIEALAEIIESKMQRLSMVSEDESLSELVDKKKMKEMQKEIKLLEKRKAGFEKLYEKSCGKKYQQQEIIGGVTEEEEITESKSFTSNPNIKELEKGLTVRITNNKKNNSGPGTFTFGSEYKTGKIISIDKNEVTVEVNKKPIIVTPVGKSGYMGSDFEIVNESKKALKLNEISKREAENLKKLEQFKRYAKDVMDNHDGDFTKKDIDSLTHKDRIAYGRNNEITIEDYIKKKNKN